MRASAPSAKAQTHLQMPTSPDIPTDARRVEVLFGACVAYAGVLHARGKMSAGKNGPPARSPLQAGCEVRNKCAWIGFVRSWVLLGQAAHACPTGPNTADRGRWWNAARGWLAPAHSRRRLLLAGQGAARAGRAEVDPREAVLEKTGRSRPASASSAGLGVDAASRGCELGRARAGFGPSCGGAYVSEELAALAHIYPNTGSLRPTAIKGCRIVERRHHVERIFLRNKRSNSTLCVKLRQPATLLTVLPRFNPLEGG